MSGDEESLLKSNRKLAHRVTARQQSVEAVIELSQARPFNDAHPLL